MGVTQAHRENMKQQAIRDAIATAVRTADDRLELSGLDKPADVDLVRASQVICQLRLAGFVIRRSDTREV